MGKDEFEELITKIKNGLDETSGALISDDLLGVVSNYNLLADELETKNQEIAKLNSDKEELLKVNGRLFQKIGFDKQESEKEETKEEVIKIEDIINEKGDLK